MLRIKTISIFAIIALMTSGFSFSAYAQGSPSVTTGQASFIAARNVYLQATVNPNGSYTNVWFEFGENSNPTSTRGHQGIGSGTSTINVQAGVINLKLDTTYYYRAIARNSSGTVSGSVVSFKTPVDESSYSGNGGSSGSGYTPNSNYSSNSGSDAPLAPTVSTNGPASVGSTTAVVNGSVNPNNVYTTYWFDFGSSPSLGQKTSVQPAGVGNTNQLVTGNFSGLIPGATYYYRATAQNSQGTASGEIKSFTTSTSGSSSSSGSTGGQVLGATSSINGNGSNSGNSVKAGSPNTSSINSRPSFISLEYSLGSNNALVLVADDAKAMPGEEFSYTIVYKNDTQHSFSDANLKVIIPSEADYVGANQDSFRTSGNVSDFDLGDIISGGQGEVVVVVKIKETAQVGSNLIFTSVLGYKNSLGVQLATTSYLKVLINPPLTSLSGSASLLGLFSGTATLWLIALGLIILLAILTFRLLRLRSKNKSEEEDSGSIFETIPPAILKPEPVSIPPLSRPNFTEAPMGKPDIFQPVN